MPATHADWTIEMLDALPEDLQRYEIIDGVLHVTPAPSEVHQLVVLELAGRLRDYLRGSDVGRVMISPADVWRGDRRRNRVQPDVFVLRLQTGRRPPYPYLIRDLLLAIEVQSPGNPTLDYQIKRRLYLAEGLPEYWIVDPDARVVSRWRNVDEPGAILGERLEWQPEGIPTALQIDLQPFFDDALR